MKYNIWLSVKYLTEANQSIWISIIKIEKQSTNQYENFYDWAMQTNKQKLNKQSLNSWCLFSLQNLSHIIDPLKQKVFQLFHRVATGVSIWQPRTVWIISVELREKYRIFSLVQLNLIFDSQKYLVRSIFRKYLDYIKLLDKSILKIQDKDTFQKCLQDTR